MGWGSFLKAIASGGLSIPAEKFLGGDTSGGLQTTFNPIGQTVSDEMGAGSDTSRLLNNLDAFINVPGQITSRGIERNKQGELWKPGTIDLIVDPANVVEETAEEVGRNDTAQDVVKNPVYDALITAIASFINPGIGAGYRKFRGEMLESPDEQSAKEAGLTYAASAIAKGLGGSSAPTSAEAAVSAEAGTGAGSLASQEAAAPILKSMAENTAYNQSIAQGLTGQAGTAARAEMAPQTARSLTDIATQTIGTNAAMSPLRLAAESIYPTPAPEGWAGNTQGWSMPDYSANLDPNAGTIPNRPPASVMEKIMASNADRGSGAGYRMLNRLRRG